MLVDFAFRVTQSLQKECDRSAVHCILLYIPKIDFFPSSRKNRGFFFFFPMLIRCFYVLVNCS